MRSIAALVVFLSATQALAGDAASSLKSMRAAWKKTRDYQAELHVRQRVDGVLYKEQITFFLFRSPSDIYAKRLNAPNQNAEALYRGPSWNSGKIMANKGSFPNLTLSLDPLGSMAMAGQNHPIHQSHLGVFIGRVLADLSAAESEGVAAAASLGAGSVDGLACERLSFSTNPKTGKEYTPKAGDSWRSIAKAQGADWVALRYVNEGKKPNDSAQTLFVPTYYAAKWEVCLDSASGLPLSFQSWDAAGKVMDQYELHKFKHNAGLSDADFDPKNPSYHF
jgi:outer membrane lipoprotein-sorting protein